MKRMATHNAGCGAGCSEPCTCEAKATKEEIADEILGSEAFLWLMCGSNYIESHLANLRPAWDAWLLAGGKSWGRQ